MRPHFIALLFLQVLSSMTASGQTVEVLQEARMLVAEDDHRAAIGLLEGVSADSLTPAGRYLLGVAYQATLQHGQALRVLSEADTTDARVLAALGRSLDLLGRSREAAAHYAAAYSKDSTDQRIALSLARAYADLDRWEDVPPIYERLLAEEDSNAFVHAQLAVAYRALDSLDGAIVHFERARQLNPRSVGVVLQLAGVYMQTDRLFSARRVVDAALAEQPEEPVLWQRSGDVALKEEDYERAAESFRMAIVFGDSTALNLRNFGVSLYLTRQYVAAYEPLRASWMADSTDGMAAFYLGMVHQQRGEYDEALRYLNQAMDRMGRGMMANVLAQVAATYDRMDRDADAVRTYRTVQSLDPDKVDVLFHLAALYDTYYADPSAALQHYTEFLSRVPEAQFTDLQEHARQRVGAIREKLFFESSPAARGDTISSDSIRRDE